MKISRSTYTALGGDGEGTQKVNIKLRLIFSENTLIAYKIQSISKSEAKSFCYIWSQFCFETNLYETVVSTQKTNKKKIKEKTVKQW